MPSTLEQVAGIMDIKVSQEDDLIFTFQLPFNASGYSWFLTAHEYNGVDHSIPIISSVQSSILTYLQATFYASVISSFDISSANKEHSYKLKYIDDNGLSRRFIEGALEVV